MSKRFAHLDTDDVLRNFVRLHEKGHIMPRRLFLGEPLTLSYRENFSCDWKFKSFIGDEELTYSRSTNRENIMFILKERGGQVMMPFLTAIEHVNGFREMVQVAEDLREAEEMREARKLGEDIERQEYQKVLEQRYRTDVDFGSW